MKKLLILLTALLLGLTAANAQTWNCGNYPSNSVTATLSNGTLTVSGSGAMASYDCPGDAPWGSNNSIYRVVMSSGVTSIGSSAFGNLNNLTSVTISSSVTSIGNEVFSGCTKLTYISIPANVTSIGVWVFYGCMSLTSISVAANNASFTSENGVLFNKSKTTLIAYLPGKQKGMYSIPSSVTSISNRAFGYCTNLTAVSIPSSVTSIGDYAFESCASLTSVSIPNGSIGMGVFQYCSGLTSVTIGSGVTSIGISAFYLCPNLTSATVLRTTPPTLGGSAFQNVHSNFCVNVPSGALAAYQASNSSWRNLCLQSCAYSWNVGHCGNNTSCTPTANVTATLCGDVLTISGTGAMKYALWENQWPWYRDNLPFNITINNITINEGVTNIGAYAFNSSGYYNTYTALTIPSSVTSVDDYALSEISLYRLNIFNPTPPTGYFSFVPYYPSSFCIWVPQEAFDTYLNSYWHYGCINGCRVGNAGTNVKWKLCDGVLTIFGSGAMTNYTMENYPNVPWFNYANQVTSIVIEQGVTNIGGFSFPATNVDDYANLTSVWINDDDESFVASIGDYAFNSCASLHSINIPYSVTSIGSNAFEWCTSLTYLYIPGNVTFIGERAFRSCNLYSITIPNSVTNIGNNAFQNSGLTSVTFNATNCTTMGSSTYPVFEGCSALATLTIGGSVTRIPNYAFKGCNGLTSVTIPNSVTNIGDEAFQSCTSLTSATLTNTTPPTLGGSNVFNNVHASFCVNVPSGAFNSYVANSNWRAVGCINGCRVGNAGTNVGWRLCSGVLTIFGTGAMTSYANASSVPWYSLRNQIISVVVESGVTSIGSYAFYDCYNATSVSIAGSVTSIGNYAFNGCGFTSIILPEGVISIGNYVFESSSLQSITLPNSLTGIGQGAFYDIGLNSVTFGNNLTTIGSSAFYNCPLTEVILPNSVTSIGTSAFESCTSLAAVTLSSNITSISNSAFSSCTSLAEITIPNKVTSVGSNAFYGCTNLREVSIGSSVTTLGSSAFYNCSQLTSITSLNPAPPAIGSNALWNISRQTCCLYVPPGAEPAYKIAAQWQDFLCVKPAIFYTVTFNSLGGSPTPLQQTIPHGNKIAAPNPAPTRNSYTFAGWYADTTNNWSNGAWSFAVDTVTANTTLFARWARNIDNYRCTEGTQFNIKIPFRSLSQGDTVTYRWYRNGTLIVGSNGIATAEDSHITCTIPPNEAHGVNITFYFEYILNDECCYEWTPSPKYRISFLP